MTEQQQIQFTVDELGEHWGPILSQSFVRIIALKKELAAALASYDALTQELERIQKEMAAALASYDALTQELERIQKEMGESENRHHEHVHRLESELELLKGEKSQGAIKVSEAEGTNKRLS